MAEGMGWDEQTVIYKRPPKNSQFKTPQAVNAAQRRGEEIETTKKYYAGQNKQHTLDKDTAKLDRETEELHHNTLGLDVGKLIQQARAEKKITQKELATKINEKPQVVNEYESGKAIPNQTILTKLERVLGVKLRGKDKGQAIQAKVPKHK